MLRKLIPVDLARPSNVEYSLSSHNLFNILLFCENLVVLLFFILLCLCENNNLKVQFGQCILVVMSIFGMLRVKY